MKKEQNLQEPQKQALNIPVVMPSFDSPKNWTGDYKLENGNYICRCIDCKEYFYGYKRRVFCFECAGNLD